jgi:calcium binding protein 39
LLACCILQDLLTRHKQVVAQFLQDNFSRFFDAFSALLQSNNYVTRRQSLKVSTDWLSIWAELWPLLSVSACC